MKTCIMTVNVPKYVTKKKYRRHFPIILVDVPNWDVDEWLLNKMKDIIKILKKTKAVLTRMDIDGRQIVVYYEY